MKRIYIIIMILVSVQILLSLEMWDQIKPQYEETNCVSSQFVQNGNQLIIAYIMTNGFKNDLKLKILNDDFTVLYNEVVYPNLSMQSTISDIEFHNDFLYVSLISNQSYDIFKINSQHEVMWKYTQAIENGNLQTKMILSNSSIYLYLNWRNNNNSLHEERIEIINQSGEMLSSIDISAENYTINTVFLKSEEALHLLKAISGNLECLTYDFNGNILADTSLVQNVNFSDTYSVFLKNNLIYICYKENNYDNQLKLLQVGISGVLHSRTVTLEGANNYLCSYALTNYNDNQIALTFSQVNEGVDGLVRTCLFTNNLEPTSQVYDIWCGNSPFIGLTVGQVRNGKLFYSLMLNGEISSAKKLQILENGSLLLDDYEVWFYYYNKSFLFETDNHPNIFLWDLNYSEIVGNYINENGFAVFPHFSVLTNSDRSLYSIDAFCVGNSKRVIWLEENNDYRVLKMNTYVAQEDDPINSVTFTIDDHIDYISPQSIINNNSFLSIHYRKEGQHY